MINILFQTLYYFVGIYIDYSLKCITRQLYSVDFYYCPFCFGTTVNISIESWTLQMIQGDLVLYVLLVRLPKIHYMRLHFVPSDNLVAGRERHSNLYCFYSAICMTI